MIDSAGLTDTFGALTLDGPMTLFAPTNDAFAADPNLAKILADMNYLREILKLHLIANAKVVAGGLKEGMTAGDLTFNKLDSGWQITAPGSKAMILSANIEASNGVVHLIGMCSRQQSRCAARTCADEQRLRAGSWMAS